MTDENSSAAEIVDEVKTESEAKEAPAESTDEATVDDVSEAMAD